jgi:hypothetical protein
VVLMRVVMTSEKRLNELFELALGRIQSAEVGKVGSDVVVPQRSIAAELDRLKAEIRDGGL